MDSIKSESLDGKGGLNSSDSKMSVSDSGSLDQHQDSYRTDKTKRYLHRLLRQRDSLLEKYL